MATLKITKKHHKHLNNPFPSHPKTLPFIHGDLHLNPLVVGPPPQLFFSIGPDFQLLLSSNNGGCLSISHKSSPTRSIWSTIPGQAFVSAAVVETEVEESRGSFAIYDRDVHFLCNHQTVEDVREVNYCDQQVPSEYLGLDIIPTLEGAQYPLLVITGWVLSGNNKKKITKLQKKTGVAEGLFVDAKAPSVSAKYWVVFYQKNSHQVGFQFKFGKPNLEYHHRQQQQLQTPHQLRSSLSSSVKKYVGHKLSRIHKIRIRRIQPQSGFFGGVSRAKGFVSVSTRDGDRGGKEVVKYADFNRICFTYASEGSERFYGFGEQFSHMDFKGKRVPIFVQEQGIGRGDQPITFAINLVSYRAAGDWSTTYAPSPFYMTSKMRSLYLEGYNYSIFDLTREDKVQIQTHGNTVQGAILHGNSPTELIEAFTETIGRPPELPRWITSGAVVGMQGGTDRVRHIWDSLKAYDVPFSAFWLQDWVGQRETLVGSQLWWNWEVDTTRYRGWTQLVQDLKEQNVKVMTYCNPCLAPAGEKPNRRRNLFEEAKKLGILVKDRNGEPYMVPNTAFDVGMLDLTHPNTSPWFKKILQDMVDDGVRGWMADFGEGLPVDAVLHSGEDPITAHNRYPELWAQINREFVDEWRGDHLTKEKEDPNEDLVFFMRAGFRESPKWGMLFWEGDQMVSWQTNDGIKSAVVGLLSSGLSGYALNHSDIGGYCAVNLPFINYQRTEELLFRWMEFSAFTTVFRTHEGNKPLSNIQFYSNHQTLSQFVRFAKVFKAWEFYRIQLVKEAAQKGLPVCRHLFLHYPEDEYVHKLTYQQFLVGKEILVVPVLDKGRKDVKAYFPLGKDCSWKHIWTGRVYTEQGCEARVEAPMGYPAVFVKSGSLVGEMFLRNLKDLSIL